jgi:5-methyltetrahydrofolate--homocysteine methyltransferase
LLQAPETCGVTLSDNFAMSPASAVSGFYFSHPDARYFAVGKIGRDQVNSVAQRKDMTVEEVERWLAPVLDY